MRDAVPCSVLFLFQPGEEKLVMAKVVRPPKTANHHFFFAVSNTCDNIRQMKEGR